MTADQSDRLYVYDGFISYSHAADDLLAPRLQAGLQRFAKPWWRRRAVRMFRDESSLAANPHLWASIANALDSSAWFVLLLSEDAASSEWVGREIEHWLANKDPGRILPVVTNGEFGWDGDDVAGSSVPPALRGVFSEEPRWVDLRFASGDDLVDLKNPEFSAAVADISSAIRGVPKDELASEEVRQHRRAMRTAWAGSVLVSVLGIAAAVFGVQSANNARVADDLRRDEAQAREQAEANLELAQENERIAEENAHLAEANALTNESRFLAVSASTLLESDPELAMLLALRAMAIAPSEAVAFEAYPVLRDAVSANRLVARFEVAGLNSAVISPDGASIFVSSWDEGTLFIVDVDSGDVVGEYFRAGEGERVRWVTISRDGTLVALAVEGPETRVVLFDALTGRELSHLASDGCPFIPEPPIFSPDGRLLSFRSGTAECDLAPNSEAASPDSDWAVAYDTNAGQVVERIEIESIWAEYVHFAGGSSLALVNGWLSPESATAEVRSLPDLELEFILESAFWPAINDSGSTIVYHTAQRGTEFVILDVESRTAVKAESLPPTEDRFFVTGQFRPPYFFSPSGTLVAVATIGGNGTRRRFVIHNVSDGSLEFALPATTLQFAGTMGADASWTADGTRLLTARPGRLLLWDARPALIRAADATEDPVTAALAILTRGFTEAECFTYRISPCPTTPEELRIN